MANTLHPDSFGLLITDVARLMRSETDRRLDEAGIGLTPSECRALVYATRAGAVRQTVLAALMGLEAMTLSTCLDRLEAEGLVERRPDPADRRAKLVVVTDKADAALAAIAPIAAAVRADASLGVAQEDMETLMRIMTRLRANLSARKSAA